MGAIGEGVEEQVRHGNARQMLRIGRLGGEQQPLGRDPRLGSQIPQALVHRLVGGENPQHRAGRAGQNAHPEGEGLGRDLLRAVEAGEHEGLFRQSQFRPRGRFRDGALAVDRLGAGNVQHRFRIIDLASRRDHHAVGDEVIVERAAHGAGIAAEVHDDRGGTVGEDFRARVLSVAVHVDKDIDAVRVDAPAMSISLTAPISRQPSTTAFMRVCVSSCAGSPME